MSATEYGRITQDHEHKNNIGRNKVRNRNADGYIIRNEGPVAVELRHGRIVHESRGLLVLISETTAGDRAILSQSIWTYKFLKKKHWLSPIAE
jgi:hypothetical protein